MKHNKMRVDELTCNTQCCKLANSLLFCNKGGSK